MSTLLIAAAVAAAPLSANAGPLSPEQIRQREELLFGQPPRVAPVANLDEEMKKLTMPPPGFGTAGEVTTMYRVMLNNPELVRSARPVGEYFLLHGTLAVRDRELMVLRVAWLCQAPFEWGEHVKIARKAGLTTADIERIVRGSTAPEWNERDRALLQSVEELKDSAMISDATWAVLARSFNEKQLVELPMLVGQYLATAFWQNSLRIPLREGNAGLAAR